MQKGSHLSMWIRNNKLERMGLYVNASGTLTPIPDLKPDQKMLKDFIGSTICVRRIGMTFTRW